MAWPEQTWPRVPYLGYDVGRQTQAQGFRDEIFWVDAGGWGKTTPGYGELGGEDPQYLGDGARLSGPFTPSKSLTFTYESVWGGGQIPPLRMVQRDDTAGKVRSNAPRLGAATQSTSVQSPGSRLTKTQRGQRYL